MGRHRGHVRPRLVGDVLRQLEMNGARTLLLRHAERLPHHRRNGRRTDDLMGHLGQRRHGRDDVHDLKARLLAAQDSLLAGDHHHGHRAEQRVGRAGRQVESAGAERGEADPGPAGQPPMGRRHERRRLLMTGQHQLDRGAPQRLDDVEVLFPGNPEDLPHALVLERGDKQFGAVHRMRSFFTPLPSGPRGGRGEGMRAHRRGRESASRASAPKASAPAGSDACAELWRIRAVRTLVELPPRRSPHPCPSPAGEAVPVAHSRVVSNRPAGRGDPRAYPSPADFVYRPEPSLIGGGRVWPAPSPTRWSRFSPQPGSSASMASSATA